MGQRSEQGWDIAFGRLVNDWEVEWVVELLGKIGGISMNSISSVYRRGLQLMAGTQNISETISGMGTFLE